MALLLPEGRRECRCQWHASHYPTKDITVAVLAAGENAAWTPVKAIDEAVGM
jgi:hypothetical protein